MLFLLACSAPPAPAPADTDEDSGGVVWPEHPDALVKHVVVVVLDGLRMAESLGEGTSDIAGTATEDVLPSIRGSLVPQGTVVSQGLALGQTITIPAHAELLTGVRQEFGHFPADGGLWQYMPLYPTLFEELSPFARPGELVITGNSEFMEQVARSVYPGATDAAGASYELVLAGGTDDRPEPSDVRALDAVRERLGERPWLTVVNLHSIDSAGHYADDPYDYLLRARQADPAVLDLWSWVQSEQSGIADETALVVLADHGRHAWGDEAEERLGEDIDPPEWRNHGDHCGGCRSIPIFVVGPGIKANATVEGPYTLEDVGRTLAWMLGVDLPYGTGVVMRDLFIDPPDAVDRAGDYEVAASGNTRATWSWSGDDAHRSTVSVDGELVSDPTAFAAEAPSVLAAGSTVYACWREYRGVDADGIDWPWIPVCEQRVDGAWTDLLFPQTLVTPLWRPALGVDSQGRLVVAWVDNPNTTTYTESRAALRVYRWSDVGGWEFTSAEPLPAGFPGPASLQIDGDDAVLAWAESDMSERNDNTSGRYTRHVEVQRFSLDGPQTVTPLWRTYGAACPVDALCPDADETLDEDGNAWLRSESPALSLDGNHLRVAWIGWDERGSHLMMAESTDGGFVWSTPTHVDASGRVFGHVSPRWSGADVVWGRLTEAGAAEVCRGGSATDVTCADVGSARINTIAVGADGVYATVDTGVGAWSVQEVVW